MSQYAQIFKSSIVVAVFFVAAHASAQTIISSDISVSDISVQINDLNLEDGISSGIKLVEDQHGILLEISSFYKNGVLSSYNLSEISNSFLVDSNDTGIVSVGQGGNYSARFANGTASSSTINLDEIDLTFQTTYKEANSSYDNTHIVKYAAAYNPTEEFYLTPNTSITISGKLNSSVLVDRENIDSYAYSAKNQIDPGVSEMGFYAESFASIELYSNDQWDQAILVNGGYLSALPNGNTEWLEGTIPEKNIVQDFSISFSNTTTEDVRVNFSFNAISKTEYWLTLLNLPVKTDSVVPSIPEPSTYALMALGLVGIGAVARRSRPATLA